MRHDHSGNAGSNAILRVDKPLDIHSHDGCGRWLQRLVRLLFHLNVERRRRDSRLDPLIQCNPLLLGIAKDSDVHPIQLIALHLPSADWYIDQDEASFGALPGDHVLGMKDSALSLSGHKEPPNLQWLARVECSAEPLSRMCPLLGTSLNN